MVDRKVEEVESTDELEPSELDDPGCEEEGDPPKDVRTDDSVAEGFLLVFWLQVLDHGSEDGCIVDGEDSFHQHEAKNNDDVRRRHSIRIV